MATAEVIHDKPTDDPHAWQPIASLASLLGIAPRTVRHRVSVGTLERFATPDGKARFFDAAYQPVAEARDARYPFSLNTGRLRDQWHGMSRTGTLGRCRGFPLSTSPRSSPARFRPHCWPTWVPM